MPVRQRPPVLLRRWDGPRQAQARDRREQSDAGEDDEGPVDTDGAHDERDGDWIAARSILW